MENSTFTERGKNKSHSSVLSCPASILEEFMHIVESLFLYSPINTLQVTEFWFTSHINKKRLIISFLTEI